MARLTPDPSLELRPAHDHALEATGGGVELMTGALGLLLHVGAMVAVMGVVAVLVYERLGVAVLRKPGSTSTACGRAPSCSPGC